MDDQTMQDLQHKTLLLLDKKFQTRKKTMYLAGRLAGIANVICTVFLDDLLIEGLFYYK